MSETSDSSVIGPIPEQLLPGGNQDSTLHASWEAAREQRAAQEAWLERRDIGPADTPHLTMTRREFDLFRNAPQNYQGYTRELYGIPQDDQVDCQYALVDLEPEDPSLPPEPLLTLVTEIEFGTTIDREMIDMDFQIPDSDPDNPNRSGDALKTVNIAETLERSSEKLKTLATKLMEGKTTDPLSKHYGDVGVRAGDCTGQKDAYVWTTSRFTKSVELTINLPHSYDSVCVVRGQIQEAGNEKAGMAQIKGPEVALKIEGENLRELQEVYQDLYRQPDFALTEEQVRRRDELFNDYLESQISKAASDNRKQAHQERYRRQQLQQRTREIPRS